MIKKLFSVGEIVLGVFFVVCVFFNDTESSLGKSLGFELNIKNALLFGGLFYLLRSVVQIISELAEPTSKTFLKKFVLFFEIVTSFAMVITGFCDGRETIIEKYYDSTITINHGLVFLSMLYLSKSLLQLAFDDNSVA